MSLHPYFKHLDRPLTVKGSRRAEAILSWEKVDGDGELTLISGMDISDFAKSARAFKNHKYADGSVGTWTDIRKTTLEGVPALTATLIGPPPDVSAVADQTWREIHAGLLPGASIGFVSLERGDPRLPDQTGVTHVRSRLIEASVVSLPSCGGCLITSKSCGCHEGGACNCRTQRRVVTTQDVIHRNLLTQYVTAPRATAPMATGPSRAYEHNEAVKGWMLGKSDQSPSVYCPRGLTCPARGPQLPIRDCPATDCPLKTTLYTPDLPTGKGQAPRYEVDRDDEVALDARDLPLLREALVRELRGEMRAMLRPMLQRHRLATTGRLD